MDEIGLMDIGNVRRTFKGRIDGIIDVSLGIPPHPDPEFNKGHRHHQQIGGKENAREILAQDTSLVFRTMQALWALLLIAKASFSVPIESAGRCRPRSEKSHADTPG